jgi:arylsulfatase A-like enzyme
MADMKGDPEQVEEFDGISLAPLLKNPQANIEQREMYWHYPHYYQTTTPVSAIRQGDWKLLEFFEDNHLELYSLKDDIGETKNLVATKPSKTAALHKLLTEWRENVNAPMPRPNPDYKESESGKIYMK